MKSRSYKPGRIRNNWDLYCMLIPVAVFYILFHYAPMYGVQIAFKDFLASKGIWGSPWVGMKHFNRFFNSYYFERLLFNTISISVYQLVFGFLIPILLALMINEVRSGPFKKLVQNITYAPHFLSVVVIAGMLTSFLHPEKGIVNHFIMLFGGESIDFLSEPSWFKPVYIISGIWQNAGWNSIIYISALAGIDPQLHEAAKIDGAGRLARIIHVNLPGILPTIVILLILNVGQIMNVGFEKVFLLQNDLNKSASDIISTFSYSIGIKGGQYSFASAIGLFNSVINFTLLVLVNTVSRKLGETSLW